MRELLMVEAIAQLALRQDHTLPPYKTRGRFPEPKERERKREKK